MVAATTTRRRPITVQTATGPQVAFWGSPERFRAFVGGIGSGKTYAGTVEILRQPAGSTGMVVAPTYPMLRDATLRTFADLARPLAGLGRNAAHVGDALQPLNDDDVARFC